PAATSRAGVRIMKNARFTGSPTSQPLRSRPVLCPAGIRLPQYDVRNPRSRRQIFQLPRDLIVKIFRHVFRRRIDGLEMLEIVHELVVELAHDLADHRLELREVNQKSGGMKFRAFQRHAHAIIVAVHVLALPPITSQGMPRRKSLFYADLKHVSPELRNTIAADLPGSWPIRKDLPIWHLAARRRRSNRESRQHRPVRA